MKKKVLAILLFAEAILCVLFCVLSFERNVAGEILLFPFGWIGLGLKALAQLGRFGNAAALTLCVGIAGVPIGYYLRIRSRRKLKIEDYLLLFLSIGIFAAIYFSANPAYLNSMIAQSTAGESMLCGTMNVFIWSIFLCYVVFRILRNCGKFDKSGLKCYLQYLLAGAAVLYVYQALGSELPSILREIAALCEEQGSCFTVIFLGIRGALNLLPWLMNVYTIFLILDVIQVFSFAAAEKLGRWCGRILGIVMLSQVAVNLLQILCAARLQNIDIVARLPLFSLIFTLATLLFAHIVRENTRLKQENDLFI